MKAGILRNFQLEGLSCLAHDTGNICWCGISTEMIPWYRSRVRQMLFKTNGNCIVSIGQHKLTESAAAWEMFAKCMQVCFFLVLSFLHVMISLEKCSITKHVALTQNKKHSTNGSVLAELSVLPEANIWYSSCFDGIMTSLVWVIVTQSYEAAKDLPVIRNTLSNRLVFTYRTKQYHPLKQPEELWMNATAYWSPF